MLGKRWHHSTEMGTIYTKLADTRQLLTSCIPHIVYNKRIDITLVGFFFIFQTFKLIIIFMLKAWNKNMYIYAQQITFKIYMKWMNMVFRGQFLFHSIHKMEGQDHDWNGLLTKCNILCHRIKLIFELAVVQIFRPYPWILSTE